MDKKISQLTAASTPLTGTEEIAIVQSGVTKKATIEDVKGYRVYTALLTQSGGDDPLTLSSGPVVKGVTYYIAPNNNDGTYFIAINDEIPNSYGTAGLNYNSGAPVVTVLENTIGNIWFTYNDVGDYSINSNTLFSVNKTTIATLPNQYVESPADLYNFSAFPSGPSIIGIYSYYNYILQNSLYGGYAQTSIEIRVYN